MIKENTAIATDLNSVSDKQNQPSAESETADYLEYSRPGLGKLLKAIRVDVNYHKAEGCYLYYKNEDTEVQVLDVVAGYGACLFGHNYQPFVEIYQKYLLEKRPFLAQASKRDANGLLGKKLNELIFKATNKNYVSLTFNTGAESAEATIKYADFHRKKITTQIWNKFKSLLFWLASYQSFMGFRLTSLLWN